MFVYFPSCNFKRLFPETAKKIRAWMETQPDVTVAGCCKVTTALPQPGDTIVTVCLSCAHLLEEMRPDVPQISLYEFLLTREDFPWPDLSGETFVLQDCFRARGMHALHDAVRACLTRCGAGIAELPANRDEADFDGAFLLHPPYPLNVKLAPKYFGEYLPAHLTVLPEEEWPEHLRRYAQALPPGKTAAYCNTCVAGLRQGGAEAYHLAELLFG